MDGRELRALAIAATTQLRPNRGVWAVPSQSGAGLYAVNVDNGEGTCTCPDYELRGGSCKHILAVEFTIRREAGKGGRYKVTEQVKVTYTQEWSAYNAAQCEEKDRFVTLLADLCSGVATPVPSGPGRPRLPLGDMVFACTYKVYSRFSSRRFTSDLRDARESGLIARVPHFNSVTNYMSNPALLPVLKGLVTTSSLPLKAIETDFAVDSSGFSTCRFVKWFNKKYGRETDNREWVKAHLMCGVLTHIVTGVEISGWAAHDTNFFRPLLAATAENFRISEVSADKAYSSHANLAAVEKAGGRPFVPFRDNTAAVALTEDSAWARMYHLFAYDRERFLAHYHKRSNVESTFSMLKGKFGDSVMSKSDAGQANEVLCKVLAHNICVLIQAIHELGIEPPAFRQSA